MSFWTKKEGWRYTLVGAELVELMDGSASLHIEGGRLVVEPVNRG